ncbi:Putative telomerase activating protein Est1 [Septoria linicola]|uniref:Nonsense-mediated mRNA decay factor n=1 Tax=Septoria linicola TaxID=215465 RepID=A0A9Q9APV4_9PEZI|nr:putative telomerase activating protein Est1 [Septoria linicola]USW49881.1 Putative telomerase activating protein Est1 [Septoria linicola]
MVAQDLNGPMRYSVVPLPLPTRTHSTYPPHQSHCHTTDTSTTDTPVFHTPRDTVSPTIPHSTADRDFNGQRVHRHVHAIREVHLTSKTPVTDSPSLESGYAPRIDLKSMDFLLANERAAEQHVLDLLSKFREQPFESIYEAFNQFRQYVSGVVPLDFDNAEAHETRLWHVHTLGRKHFHRALSDFRKSDPPQVVATRQVTKSFLTWLKQSEKFYRSYITMLSEAAGGVPELEAIAHRDNGERASESAQLLVTPSHRNKILDSCHRALIWLGDLARYRATEKLDKTPDFGPAIGYYGLAATLKPTSGLGHHQQAVVALAQNHHLRAIYHLYRSISVEEAHPLAPSNLRLEFDKTNAAWDKGELIEKRSPNDPDAAKLALVGWFVRLHSMCYKGEPFREHEELEREVLSQLANVIKQRPLDGTLMRMVLVNISAQYIAGEQFQAHQTVTYQQSFYYYFRLNLKTFTTLLRTFYDDLRVLLLNMSNYDVELASKLTQLGCRLLPCLRVYNNWLCTMVAMIQGLSTDDFIADSVSQFWPAYARTIDLIAQAFPIWDLEDVEEIEYMLEEDIETLQFTPLLDEQTRKTWFIKASGTTRARFSDRGVVRSSREEEMLHRVRDFLSGGLNLASGVEIAPVSIRGTRIYYGDGNKVEALTVPERIYEPIEPPKKAGPPKPVSYAAAAANGHAQKARPLQPARQPTLAKNQARDAQLSRMVDNLLDEEDDNNPITPPQPATITLAILNNDDLPHLLQDSVHDLPVTKSPKHTTPIGRPSPKDYSARANVTFTPTGPWRPVSNTPATSWGGPRERLQSVSELWEAPGSTSPSFPAGLPTGTLGSPANVTARGHSRVNSASSIRSKNSLNVIDSWTSNQTADSWAPRVLPDNMINNDVSGTRSSVDQNGMASPLLFGAGNSPWSLQPAFRHASPPYGPGG